MKKMLSTILAGTMLFGTFTAVNADDTAVSYTEDFESITADEIKAGGNGWYYGTYDDNTEYDIYVSNYGDDVGNDTNAMRIAATNWWNSSYAGVYLYDAGVSKGAAEADMTALLSDDLTLSFKVNFGIPNPEQAGPNTIRISDANGNIVLKLATPWRYNNQDGVTDKLILNDTYTVVDPIENAEHNTAWYNISIAFDFSESAYKLTVNDTVFTVDGSEWIASASSFTGSMIKELFFEIYQGAWWQSLYVDDISVTAGIESSDNPEQSTIPEEESPSPSAKPEEESPSPSATPEEESPSPAATPEEESPSPSATPEEESPSPSATPEEESPSPTVEPTETPTVNPEYADSIYYEDYDTTGTTDSTIKNSENGWYNGTYDGNTDYDLYVQSFGEDIGNDTNAMRIAATNWWNSSYAGVYLKDAGVALGASEADMTAALSDDVTISFKMNFAVPNPEQAGSNTVRIIDSNSNILVQLQTTSRDSGATDNLLLTVGGNTYTMAETIENAEHNTTWYDISVAFDFSESAVRVSVNDTVFTVGGNEWIATSTALEGSMINELFFEIYQGAWWQSIYVDDIAVTAGIAEIEGLSSLATITSVSRTDTAVTVNAKIADGVEGTVIAAAYVDGAFADVVMDAAPEAGTAQYTLDIGGTSAVEVKLFVWDMTTNAPLSKVSTAAL